MLKAKFSIGDIIHHKHFNYRGVIFNVDDSMQLSDEWYEQVAKSRPPEISPGITSWLITILIPLMLQNKIWN